MISTINSNNIASQRQNIAVSDSIPESIQKQQERDRIQDIKNKERLREELLEMSRQLNQEMQKIKTNIDFSYNDDICGLIVTVKEADGDRIIREIPSKEAIELMKKMRDIVGLIFDKKG